MEKVRYADLTAPTPVLPVGFEEFDEDADYEPRPLNQETREVLLAAGVWLEDRLREEVLLLKDDVAFESMFLSRVLPGCFAHHYTPELVERFIAETRGVAGKLAKYPDTYLASTAEELLAHALIGEGAELIVEERKADRELVPRQASMVMTELDELADDAFEDHDVLLLFDPRSDGIEDSDIAGKLGFANLHVNDWFTPFRP